jgi:hypothetical protein
VQCPNGAPADELVEHIDIRLQVNHLRRLLRVEDSERRHGCAVIDVATSRLKEATNEENLKERVRIFQEFKRNTSLDKFVSKALKVVFWDRLQMLVKLIAEY